MFARTHTYPVKRLEGEGKEMVPGTPPLCKRVELGLRSNHLCSATDQLIPAQPLINVPLFVGACGALNGDVWILSWGALHTYGTNGIVGWGRTDGANLR